MGVEFSLSVLPDLSVIVMVSPSPGMKCRVAAGAFIRMAKPLPGTWSVVERVTGWRASQPATCPQKVEGGLQEKICKSLSQVEYHGNSPCQSWVGTHMGNLASVISDPQRTVAIAKRVVLLLVLAGLALRGATNKSSAQTLTTLYQFGGLATDGRFPTTGLVQGSDGFFYGTSNGGGTNGNGTVFQISPAGTLTTLRQFGINFADVGGPNASLVQGSDGFFYGTSTGGGVHSAGTVFRIGSAGGLSKLYEFTLIDTNGAFPYGGLVQSSDGFFYGTTSGGGTNGNGTVFRLSSGGELTTLHQFGGADGSGPRAALARGSGGNFYGTTYYGGSNNLGTVFRISSSGTLTTLHQFGGADGANPYAGLAHGSDDRFYGTTSMGGTNNLGTVFQISSNGALTTLHHFQGPDGAQPLGGLLQGSDGNFYGTATMGGTNHFGTVFRINAAGTLTTLYQFHNLDGEGPEGTLVQGSDGNFYGTTEHGGTTNVGTVFKLSVPLDTPPYPINRITAIQRGATNVVFTIDSIAGESYQLQSRTDLTGGNWSNVPGASVTNSIGARLMFGNYDSGLPSHQFYRLAITP